MVYDEVISANISVPKNVAKLYNDLHAKTPWLQYSDGKTFVEWSAWSSNSSSIENGIMTWVRNTPSSTTAKGLVIDLGEYHPECKVGHKMVLICDCYCSAGEITIGELYLGSNKTVSSTDGQFTRISVLFTLAGQFSSRRVAVYYSPNIPEGQQITIKVKNLMIFDLTLMYGGGGEPATINDFTKQYPLIYYQRNY